jgi:hypothetical protein
VKRALAAVTVLVAVTAVLAVLSLPPATLVLDGSGDSAVPGVIHVHTNRSDGASSPEEVAAAAARAGLSFVVFTDHGTGARTPDSPVYRSGVLCLDAVEISTTGGHYLAIGLPPVPYPLGGEARDVVEDVRRLGGVGIAAHPDSPRADLQWADWSLPVDGIEILNLDTMWRRYVFMPGWAPKQRLLQALLAYPIRSHEAIGNLLTVTEENASHYAELTRRQSAVALVSVDAHSKVALRDVDPGDNRWALPFPGYETVFRTLQVRLTPERPLTGDAPADAVLVIDALRAGRLYGANTALAAPPSFEFTADGSSGTVGQGGVLPAGRPATLHVRSNAPAGFETVVLRGTEVVATTRERTLDVDVDGEAAEYRVEIRAADRSGSPVWIVSNPIYVRQQSGHAAPRAGEPTAGPESRQRIPLFGPGVSASWRVESDPESRASFVVDSAGVSPVLRLDYALAPGAPRNQFAALVIDVPDEAATAERLAMRMRSNHPARVSVQARAAVSESSDERWVRSVYLDETWREVTIDFDDMRPLGATRTPVPPPGAIHSLVFALEPTNTAPGTAGVIEVEWLEARR